MSKAELSRPIPQVIEGVQKAHWLDDNFAFPENVTRVPTMLTEEERRALVWLSTFALDGSGCVCDMGSFLGGSTVSLAQGVRNSGRRIKVHAFDQFKIDEKTKQSILYSRGYEKFAGESMFHLFEEHIQPYQDLVIPWRGRIEELSWKPQPIQILFIDIAKSWHVNDHILLNYFTQLVPGKSFVIQQDYFFPRTPWAVFTMEMLSDKLDYVGATEYYSAFFFVREQITETDIEKCLRRNTTDQQVADTLSAVVQRFQGDRIHQEPLLKLLENFERKPKAMGAWQFV